MRSEHVLERVRHAARDLAALVAGELDADDVRAVVHELRTVRTHVGRFEVDLAARANELRESGTCDDPVDLLSGVGAMPTGRARQVARNAELLGKMPALASALRSAAITDDHVNAVAVARRRVDPSVRPGFDALDDRLATYAAGHNPDQLAEHLKFVQRGLERQLTRDLDLRRRRGVRVSKWIDRAGIYQLHGSFDPEMGARIFGAIDTAVDTLRAGNPASLVPGDDPDDPLAADREFLAAHALARLVSHGHMADHPGVAEIVVLVDEQSLLLGPHDDTVCELHDGTPVEVDAVRRLCCEAMLRAVVVTADGTIPLNVGRAQRTATREQRRALRAIHRTCAIDGCSTPFDWCEIHHIWFWELNGLTDLDNLVPLCHRHHHLVHDACWRLQLDPRDRTLTFTRPDGTIHSQTRPPGLLPPVERPPDVDSSSAPGRRRTNPSPAAA
ncbi:MAG: hypothetical protein H0X22_03175 [Acidimicrobiia bacterium]|nr:hypothetical protein [Acidimicrobiia bacterium]